MVMMMLMMGMMTTTHKDEGEVDRFFTVPGNRREVTRVAQIVVQQRDDGLFVFDDQHQR